MTARHHRRGRNVWHSDGRRPGLLLPMAQERRNDRRWTLLALLPLVYFLGQLARGALRHAGWL